MLLRQTLLYLPAQIMGPLAQVLAAIVWTHWLAPAPYGLLTLLVAAQDLLFLLCLSWWTQYTLRYLGALTGAARDAFAHSESSIAALTFAAQTLGTLLVLALIDEPLSAGLIIAAIAYVGTRSLLTHLGERARAQGRIGVYTIGQAAGAVLGFALAYAGVALVVASPGAILAGFALAQAIGIVVLWRALGISAGPLLPRPALLRAALAYGAPLLVAGGAAWTSQNGIRFEVESLAGADGLGLIAVGWGLGQRLPATLAMLVIAASFPLAVRDLEAGSRAAGYRQISTAGILLMALIVPASIGLCLLAVPFTSAFVAAPFRAVTIAVLPYATAVGALRNIRMHVAEPIFLLLERPRVTTAINVVDALCILVGCLVGLRAAGLVGAVAGCLAGTLVSLALGLVLVERIAGFAFPYGEAGRVAVAGAIMAAALLALPWTTFAFGPYARMLAETLLGGLVYSATLALMFPTVTASAWRRLAYRVGTGVPLR